MFTHNKVTYHDICLIMPVKNNYKLTYQAYIDIRTYLPVDVPLVITDSSDYDEKYTTYFETVNEKDNFLFYKKTDINYSFSDNHNDAIYYGAHLHFKSSYCLFIHNDTFIPPKFIINLVNRINTILEQNNQYSTIYMLLMNYQYEPDLNFNAKESKYTEFYNEPMNTDVDKNQFINYITEKHYTHNDTNEPNNNYIDIKHNYYTDINIICSCWSTKLLLYIRGFDGISFNKYFLEDTDIFRRVFMLKEIISNNSEVKIFIQTLLNNPVYHQVSKTSRQNSIISKQIEHYSTMKYFMKWKSILSNINLPIIRFITVIDTFNIHELLFMQYCVDYIIVTNTDTYQKIIDFYMYMNKFCNNCNNTNTITNNRYNISQEHINMFKFSTNISEFINKIINNNLNKNIKLYPQIYNYVSIKFNSIQNNYSFNDIQLVHNEFYNAILKNKFQINDSYQNYNTNNISYINISSEKIITLVELIRSGSLKF